MHLAESLKRYTSEQLSARDAQQTAEFIAFGPILFQVSYLMKKWGILDMLRDQEMTVDEIAAATGRSEYAVKCLMEASLTIGTVLVNPADERFSISKTGWFLVTDPAIKVNMNFNQDVNYEGMFHLEEALEKGQPAGLRHFGAWNTIYEGLSRLPAQARKSWFAFDHFYSDSAFEEALEIVFASHPRTLLDVGGNTGRWALQCTNYDDNIEITIMDLPQQLKLMRQAVSGKKGEGRICGLGTDLLNPASPFPAEKHFDAVWMSQFLDCFSEQEAESILKRTARIMDKGTTLYIMETLWDRQKYEAASFCLTQISLYFTAMANGNSKMYHSEDLIRIIKKAGLEITRIHDHIGQGHSIICCSKK